MLHNNVYRIQSSHKVHKFFVLMLIKTENGGTKVAKVRCKPSALSTELSKEFSAGLDKQLGPRKYGVLK